MKTVFNPKDAQSAKLAEFFCTIDGRRYSMLNAKNFEATASVSNADVPRLGTPITGKKPNGLEVKLSFTVYKCSPMFDDLIEKYKNTGILPTFECDVMLSAGIQHFTLKDEDQIALLTCASLVKDGEQLIPWHPNGDKTIPCVFYSNADMKIITDMAYFHRSYHTTYCNALKVWAEATTSAEQLDLIFYGADVPEQYQSDVLKAYLLQISSMAEGNADETKASK